MKECTKCHRLLPLDAFILAKGRKDGRGFRCRECHRESTIKPPPDPSLEGEEWLPVVGWEALYEVSSLGRVRRSAPGASTYVGKILTPSRANRYLAVPLTRDGRLTLAPVHHLVARAFIGPRPKGLEIDHVNGARADNRAVNLEYVTRAENHQRMMALGLWRPAYGERSHKSSLTWEDVCRIRTRPEPVADMAIQYGVSRVAIYNILKGKVWTRQS